MNEALHNLQQMQQQARQQQQAQMPSLGAELKSMAREAIKDVRGTVQEVFFGKAEGMGEPGAPLNPTPQLITRDLDRANQVEIER